MPVPVDAKAAQVSGVMGAINAVGERLRSANAFIYWELGEASRKEYLRMLRESAKTLASYADDLERTWTEADIARPE
jgi:hypothetical protein